MDPPETREVISLVIHHLERSLSKLQANFSKRNVHLFSSNDFYEVFTSLLGLVSSDSEPSQSSDYLNAAAEHHHVHLKTLNLELCISAKGSGRVSCMLEIESPDGCPPRCS